MNKESIKRLTVLPLDDPNAVEITFNIVPPEKSDAAKGLLNLNSPLVIVAAKISPGTDFEVEITNRSKNQEITVAHRFRYRLISRE